MPGQHARQVGREPIFPWDAKVDALTLVIPGRAGAGDSTAAAAKLARSADAAAGYSGGANVAVAQVRGLLGRQRILVLE
jgi:hypothetical protein